MKASLDMMLGFQIHFQLPIHHGSHIIYNVQHALHACTHTSTCVHRHPHVYTCTFSGTCYTSTIPQFCICVIRIQSPPLAWNSRCTYVHEGWNSLILNCVHVPFWVKLLSCVIIGGLSSGWNMSVCTAKNVCTSITTICNHILILLTIIKRNCNV